jgi:hypothetical protein
VADTLLSQRAISRGYFRRASVERLVAANGDSASSAQKFSLLVLELWHQRFMDAANSVAA